MHASFQKKARNHTFRQTLEHIGIVNTLIPFATVFARTEVAFEPKVLVVAHEKTAVPSFENRAISYIYADILLKKQLLKKIPWFDAINNVS